MAKILDSIREPADIRKLTPEELSTWPWRSAPSSWRRSPRTAAIWPRTSGVVELTLALHYVFDSPRDKIVWDVGHQCYTHKILTGRKDSFAGSAPLRRHPRLPLPGGERARRLQHGPRLDGPVGGPGHGRGPGQGGRGPSRRRRRRRRQPDRRASPWKRSTRSATSASG